MLPPLFSSRNNMVSLFLGILVLFFSDKVKRHPNHKESYLRLVDVRLLMKDPAKALVACRSGLSRFPSSLELKKSEEDAMAMSQKMKGPSEQKIDPKSLPCYSKEVKYKENCVVVDAWGRGNFVSLVDALDVHATSRKPKITLIIVGCGPFTFCEPITISVASSIQIIGGVNSTHGKKKGGKTQGSSSSPLKSELKGTHQGVLFKVEGVDPKGAVDLHLQNLELHAQGHCVRAAEKANVKVENCFATSYGFASFSSYKGGKLVLERCKVPRKSNGGIVVYDAEVTAMDCRFEGSEVVSISVQNKSKCVMSGCRIVKSHAQGVIVFVGGVAEMNDCEVVECGKMPQKSGILVQDGLLRMKRCVVERNKAQGIVVQGEGDGQLFMEECTVSQNATTQVCVFQGSINIADSTILDPKIGIMFGSETPRPSSIRRCRVTSIVNTPKDALLYGNTIEKPEVENIFSQDVLAEIQKMDNISSPKLPPKLSFSNITPENFEFHFVREGILKLIPNLLLCAGSQKAVLSTKQLNVPSRITPDDQLRPTSIKKAWGSTQERSVGKVLTGTVRSPCAYIASVLTVLVDEEGDAVFLALYNFPGVTRFFFFFFFFRNNLLDLFFILMHLLSQQRNNHPRNQPTSPHWVKNNN